MHNLQELKALENVLCGLAGFPSVYYYPKKMRHWSYIGSGLYIPELDIIFVDNTLHRRYKYINKYITIYLLLHELAHSTAHPKRLNRNYIKNSEFGKRRSITKYVAEWDDYYKDVRNIEYKDTLNEYKEEIVADSAAMSIYSWLGLPKNKHVLHYYNQRKQLQRRLKLRSSNYQAELADVQRHSKKCIDYLKANLQRAGLA